MIAVLGIDIGSQNTLLVIVPKRVSCRAAKLRKTAYRKGIFIVAAAGIMLFHGAVLSTKIEEIGG